MNKTSNIDRFLTLIVLLIITQSGNAEQSRAAEICSAYSQEEKPKGSTQTEIPFADGLVWTASKNGLTNYLYGTIHTQDQRATKFPPTVRLGIFRSQHYLMEIKLSEESNRIFRDAMFDEHEGVLASGLEPELVNLLREQLTHYGFSANDADNIKPWAAFSTIGSPKPIRQPSLDQVLMNFAQSRGIEVIGIESMQDLVASLSSIRTDDQLEILRDTICNRSNIIRDSQDLVFMHMRDDLEGIVRFSEGPHRDEAVFERYMKIMVLDRNQRMLQRILPYMEQGGAFVAVGALHLPGKNGLLALLEKAGFEIRNLK